jgi:hypothetical protein
VVEVDVPAALPPVVFVTGAVPVPVEPPVAFVPVVSGVVPVPVPTPEPPDVETLPLAAGGVWPVPVPPEADCEEFAVVEVPVCEEFDPAGVVAVPVGGVALPVVGTVKVGTFPVLTVPEPPPPPHAASASAATSTPTATARMRVG